MAREVHLTARQRTALSVPPLLLRLVLAIIFIWAGYAKIFGFMDVTPENRGALVAAGVLGFAQRWSSGAVHSTTGWHTDRDVPVALRRAGLVLTDIERFSMPTRLPVLRPFVRARGQRRPGSAS